MSKRSGGNRSGSPSKANQSHHANQHNPNNPAYKANQDNRSNQLNPNNSTYHSSRGGNPKKP